MYLSKSSQTTDSKKNGGALRGYAPPILKRPKDQHRHEIWGF